MPTNQQRREAERRRLQRQLQERRAREAARKRFTLIGSVIGTLIVIGAVIGIVVATTGGGGGKHESAKDDTVGASTPSAPCAAPPNGGTASFHGLTVTGATDLKHEPKVSGKVTDVPKTVICQDLVVGTGKAATSSSTVSAQYVGVLAKTGKVFQSSWSGGQAPPPFSLAGGVITGFGQGIGGAGKIAPMHVGGRRLMILPAALAYGANPPDASIPPNAPLVFVVDLQKVS